jgi:hypothetical protein
VNDYKKGLSFAPTGKPESENNLEFRGDNTEENKV